MTKLQERLVFIIQTISFVSLALASSVSGVYAADSMTGQAFPYEPELNSLRFIMRDKNYKVARPLLDAHLKKKPNSSQALVYRARCYVDENKNKEALECLHRAAKADPKNAEIYSEQANIYALQKQYQKAVDAASLAIKYGKGFSVKHTYHLRSMMYTALGQKKKAIEDMCSYIKIDSAKPRAFMWRANAYEQDGQWDKALADYRTALEMSKNYEYRFHAARVLQKQGKMEQAVAEMTAIIKQNPEEDEAWNKRGNLNFAMGRYQEAVRDFTEALATSFGSNDTLYRSRGKAYEKLGQKDRAQKDFQKADELLKKPTVAPI